MHVKLKKLVDECIVDHSLRTQPAAESSEHFLPVTGLLLGTECDGEIKVSNSFPGLCSASIADCILLYNKKMCWTKEAGRQMVVVDLRPRHV